MTVDVQHLAFKSASRQANASALTSSQNVTTAAPVIGIAFLQSDVQSIATLSNSLQTSYNALQSDVSSLRTTINSLLQTLIDAGLMKAS